MYDNSFSNFGRPPVPNDSCKGSAPRRSQFWRSSFLKVFTIYGRGGHLGQRTVTILAIFHSPTLRRLHMKFEQNWLSGFRGEVIWKCWRTDRRRTKSDHNSSSWAELRWAKKHPPYLELYIWTSSLYVSLCCGFTAQSFQWGHVEHGQFTWLHFYLAGLVL